MIKMTKGYVALILHAHLPFVRHPEHADFLEERWLFEAISETYIPLLNTFDSLIKESIDFRITMSITPPLLTMLSDELLQQRYINYLQKLIELTEKEIDRTINQPEINNLAIMYNNKYIDDLYIFREKYNCNLVSAFKDFQDSGKIEIIASAATHGFLPLMAINQQAINAQITIGVQTHEKYFNKKPRGIWLPECGYTPQIESALKQNGIEYFISEAHGVLFANPKPVFGTFSPIVSPDGIVAFGRDIESSKQVWSATEGYPGDFDYREFYRDIGFELDFDYIKNYISCDGTRIHTGIKYNRITGKTEEKQTYNPEWAKNKADLHAGNFMFNREKQIDYLDDFMDRPPIIVCPYDAELFGHWWYEGPYWIYSLLKKIYTEQRNFKTITLSEYIDQNPVMQVASPCVSTWGLNGYNEVWLNQTNEWVYRHIHKSSERMVQLANENKSAQGLKKDALNQAARELLLAQSSDWAFIMKSGTMVPYAEKRTNEHIGRFTRLYHDIKEGTIDEDWLKDIQYKDNIFPELDYLVYI
jgi:1,4-alpha-glucan branching enzyme